jgi:signal peptidase II
VDRVKAADLSRAWRWFALAAAIVAVDQLVKWVVLRAFAPGEQRAVTDFFNLVLVFNKGAAFSLFAQAPGWQAPMLTVFALGASLVVGWFIVRNPGKTVFCLGLALILGGAIGNVIDRMRFGQVVDFLDLHAFGWHWPAFNVADSAICIGAALLILEGFLPREKRSDAAA